MSKIISVILLVVLQILILPIPTFASEDCSTTVGGNITYDPKEFYEPAPGEDLVLNFTINNNNAYYNLKGREVRLHFIEPARPLIGDYNTDEVTIPTDQRTFSITLKSDDGDQDTTKKMISPGEHQAVLDLKTDNKHDEMCKGIRYVVGDEFACLIDPNLPKEVPQDTKMDIKFSGKPSTTYHVIAQPLFGAGLLSETLVKATTDNTGQGRFKNVLVEGKVGDTSIIRVYLDNSSERDRYKVYCTKNIKISINAPIPTSPSDQPVALPPPGAGTDASAFPELNLTPNYCDPKQTSYDRDKCAFSGADTCGNEENPAINTAIGCIPTNPTAFIQAFLKFILGISGGLAFLMMLLGVFQMLTSAGNPDTLQAGREKLTSAVIGLLFVIFAVLLLQIIGANILNIPGFS